MPLTRSGWRAAGVGAFRGAFALLLVIVMVLGLTADVKANGPIPFLEEFAAFTAGGLAPVPDAGRLDSTVWAITGFSDGDLSWGATATAGDFARGAASGGVSTGGVYAFDVGGGNTILGLQPTGTDFTPGEIIVRLRNSTGGTISQLDLAYDIWTLNDQDRSSSLNLAYSLDDQTYTAVPALDFSTPAPADGAGWQATPRSITLSGFNLADGEALYVKWAGDDVGGSGSRDEFGLDNIRITVPAGDAAPSVSGTTPSDGAAGTAPETDLAITFSENVTLSGAWFALSCDQSGLHTAAVSGGPQSYTLNPDPDFLNGEVCTATIIGDQVADQDGPADTMGADYAFSFTIAEPANAWIINEIYADPDPAAGDANGDGLVSTTQDEFVEIVNSTGATGDLTGWTLADGIGLRHTFPAGTIVPDRCAVIVFAGGTPSGPFGGSTVQTASSGQLGLNNTGDTLVLNDGAVDLVTTVYGSEGGDDQSLTREPDVTGPDPLIKHTVASGAAGRPFSPGTRADGTPFSVCGPPDSPPSVVSTSPADGAASLPVTTIVEIQFSEPVSTTAATFVMECPEGTGLAFTASPAVPGGADRYTITPTNALPQGAACLVRVNRDEVVDLDGSADRMSADYELRFATASPSAAAAPILISEFAYDGLTPSTEGDEFIEFCNPNPIAVDLTGYKVGDEELAGGGESMYELPAGTTLAADGCLVIAKSAADFQARFGRPPDLEVSTLTKYTPWAGGSWSLSNTGDELLVLGPDDEILDSVAFRNGDYDTLQLEGGATAPEPHSLQRVWPTDTNAMPHDFVRAVPTPGNLTLPLPPPAVPPPAASLPDGMQAYWGHLHAHTTYSDGAGPPHYALAQARAAGLHFYGLTDHGWWMSFDEWTKTLSQTRAATVPGQFVALRGVEWSHDTAGHINVFNTDTLLSRTDPRFDELSEIHTWLADNPDVIAQFNHPDPRYGGTFDDFAFHPTAGQVITLLEIGNNAQRYTTYEPSFIQSNMAGWKTGPTINGDTHVAAWGTDTPARTGLVASSLTEADLLEAMRARRVFSTEDSNLALALRANGSWMGSVLTTTGAITVTVDVVDPDSEPVRFELYDRNLLLQTVPLTTSTGQWSTTVDGLPAHFYWVKAIQEDGDRAYSAPVWIEGEAAAETIYLNEVMPAPYGVDWDGSGQADGNDEWIELYNPLDRAVGLGGWRLQDAAGVSYNIPLAVSIPAAGYVLFYHKDTGIGLNNGGDTVTLIDPNGAIIDTMSYDHSPGGEESWCRLPDGEGSWRDNCMPSPGTPNSERAPAEPLRVKIYEAKRLTPGAWVKVEGKVTAPPGILGNRTMYIQDDSAGIKVYLPKDHRLSFVPGDKVEVEGNLRLFREEFEIQVDDRGDVDQDGTGAPPPPLPIATTSLLEPYEGRLIQLQGQAARFRGRSTLWLDDGTGPAKVVIRRSTGIRKPFIKLGAPVTAVGIASQYSDKENPKREDYRLLPRYPHDLIWPTTPAEPLSDRPKFLPETGY